MSKAVSLAILAFITVSLFALYIMAMPYTKGGFACKMIGYKGFEAYRCAIMINR